MKIDNKKVVEQLKRLVLKEYNRVDFMKIPSPENSARCARIDALNVCLYLYENADNVGVPPVSSRSSTTQH